MSMWQNARDFVELAFSIDKHLPGYIDAYFGPEEIRESADAKGKVRLEELSLILEPIIASTYQDTAITEERKEYLSAELNAMRTTLSILKGEDIDIVEESRGLYGLTPTWIEESVFEEAHQALDDLLPGSEPLTERMDRFREKTIIPKDRIISIVRKIADDFRHRIKEIVPLPEEETCDYSIVQDKPWTGYNWYLGKYKSRIEINTDLPMLAGVILDLVAHEAYPGHHTEHAMKEKLLYRERGYLEHCIWLSNTPAAVVSEGIAEIASEIIAEPDEIVQILQSILDQAGLKEVEGNQLYQINKAMRQLRKVLINRILMLHGRDASDEEVINYGKRFGLLNEQQSRKSLEMIKDPLWRSYGSLYPMGYDLTKEFINREGDRTERFLRLIREPITVTRLLS